MTDNNVRRLHMDGRSGIGRENGIDSIRHYTQIKSVYVSLEELDNPFA